MKTINLEIADTSVKRAYGLMDRKHLAEDSGMLFVFPNKMKHSFWMKNTYIPLDIAFLNDKGEIFQIEAMSPLSTRSITAKEPCIYAIEVNHGWFKNNGVSVGKQIFNGKDDILKAKREWARKVVAFSTTKRFAQFQVENDEVEMEEPDLIGEMPDLDGGISPEQQQMYEQPVQPGKEVEYNLDQLSKIKFANLHNLPMDIVYWTLSGKELEPRRLTPIPGEGYPIKSGPNGRYFTGFDSSANISGAGWEIKGNTPKNFLIDNIIKLEIVHQEGERVPKIEQTIEKPQNLWDRLKKNLFER